MLEKIPTFLKVKFLFYFFVLFFVSITFPQMSCEQNAPTGPDDSNDEFQIENSGEKSNVDMKTSNKEFSKTSKTTDFGFGIVKFLPGYISLQAN